MLALKRNPGKTGNESESNAFNLGTLGRVTSSARGAKNRKSSSF